MKSKVELLNELIDDLNKEYIKVEILLDFHKRELRNPVNEGKVDAVEGINTCKTRLKQLGYKIKSHEEYKKRTYKNSK